MSPININMEESMEERFQKFETAVNSLFESMTTFNPSIPAIEAVIQADDDLNEVTRTLVEHQENHERIISLRNLADTLDIQFKASIKLLADTRNELLALPWTPVKPNMRNVPVDELLLFAKNISNFTVPPSLPNRQAKVPEMTVAAPDTTPSGTQIQAEAQDKEQDMQKESFADTSLTAQQKAWLDEISQRPFVPWPNEEVIRAGALAHLTKMALEGQDPGAIGIDTSVGGADVQKDEVPSSAIQPTSAVTRETMLPAARPSIGGQERPKKAAFQGFGLYDPDEDA